MKIKEKHIILLGFKSAGKSTVGKRLTETLPRLFIDIDEQIEQHYQRQSQQTRSCRDIFSQHGELFFRACETAALKQALMLPPAIMALGGGTPLEKINQQLIQSHWLIHITASPQTVYQRLLAGGKPAFFPAIPGESLPGLSPAHRQSRLLGMKGENHDSPPCDPPSTEDPQTVFQRLWNERNAVYTQLAHLTVDNTESVDQTITFILKSLEKKI